MSQQKIVFIVFAIIVVIAILVGIVVTGILSDWFKHDIVRLYLTVGNKRITSDKTMYVGDAKFKVHNVLVKKGYKVKIVALDNTYYTVDGEKHLLSDISSEQLAKVFDLRVHEDFFEIKCTNKSLQKVVEQVYPDKEVSAPDDALAHFALEVSDKKDRKIVLKFIPVCSVESISLPGEIIL